ncbi:hypothetical protein OHB26_17140 [Nocardia sp. NBC_01503]|uniref:DddA-like double-stranded DNA deaminase toxin n=1 Tax=Nocardia sp. NBC_01503 TaxID=2975997 RepID=UPI002E7B7F5D|nr:DddA-like double-stranded DNA deaminase toxin [Nocardia sp. NBC_01503]WTL35767.1 hypothetical protein OHB26_17140 [Nocardia sp. NBC_01503]
MPDGTTYPVTVVATAKLVAFPGMAPVLVSTSTATVNQPHPLYGGTSWTATFDNDERLTRIDITSPTTGIASVAASSTGLRITNTAGTTLTVNDKGVPSGPYENPATGEKGIAEALPGGGYRTLSADGAITEYNAAGGIVNHLPAPDTSDDGWWAKTGNFVKNGIATTLGTVQHSIANIGAGLGAAASGGSLTPQGQAFIQAAAVDPDHDPAKAWRQWLDNLTVKGTLSAAGNVVSGFVGWSGIGQNINAAAGVFDLHPNLPTPDDVGKAMGDNAKAAKVEYDKGNIPGALNHLGMATGLFPNFGNINDVVVWLALFGLGKAAAGRSGPPEALPPTPVEPLPTPKTLGPGASHPATVSPVGSIKPVLDSHPQLTASEFAQLHEHLTELRAAERVFADQVVGFVESLTQAEIAQLTTTRAMAHTGPGGTPPHPQGPTTRGTDPHLAAGRDSSGTGHQPPPSNSGSSNNGRPTLDHGSKSRALGPDRDGRFPDDIDTPGVRQAFDDLPDRTAGPTSGFALDAATDRQIPYPYGKDPAAAITSDQKAPWKRAMALIKQMPFTPVLYRNADPKFAADVEMKAAIVARDLGIKNLKIVINNSSGPCLRGCDLALPYLVDPEGSITVIYPGGYRIYKGSKFKEIDGNSGSL